MYRLLIPHIKPSVREIMIKRYWALGLRSIVDGGIDAYDRSIGSVDHHRSGSDQFSIDIGLRHGSALDPLSGVHYGDGTDQRVPNN